MIIAVYTAVVEAVPIWLMWTLFVLSTVYLYMNWKPNYWKAHGVPVANIGIFRVIWIFIRKVPQHEFDQIIYNSVDREHKMFGTWELGQTNAVVVRDPDLLKDILIKDFNYFTDRRDFSKAIPKIFTKMLSLLPGEQWKTTRNLMTPTFSSGKIKKMMTLMSESADMMMGNINKAIAKNPNIDMKKTFRAFTWDVIATCAFSTKVNTEQDPNSDFARHTRNMVDRDFKLINMLTMILSPKLARLLNMDLFDHNSIEYFSQLASEMIKLRKTSPELQKRTDFLQLMIDAEKDDSVNGIDDKKKILTTELITAQAVLFFFAGSDTVASTLTFIHYFMALNPNCQDKLINELDTILKKHNGKVTYEALQEMPYMDMVIAEAQRLYPAAHRLERQCTQDHHIGDIPIKKGTLILIPIYAMQRDKQYFPEPEKFDPERFSAENKSDINPFTNMPFGMGPRNCIGNRFALLEVKMALATFFKEFTVAVCDQTPKKLTFFVSHGTRAMKSPIILKVSKRDSTLIK